MGHLEGMTQLMSFRHPKGFGRKISTKGGWALPDKAPLFSFAQARYLHSGTLQ